jgi:uncharacterized repeat protein (TIGR01451 family)
MGRFGKGSSIVVSCSIAVALLAPAASPAATFTVNTPNDTTVAGGCVTEPACSLRDAVTAASASADPDDTIAIPAGHYALVAGQLMASGPLTIRGAGARATTIDAQGASRVLNLGSGAVTIEDLAVTGGLASVTALESFAGDGGGILVASEDTATVTLRRAAVLGNVANLNGGGIAAPPENTVAGVEAAAVRVIQSTVAGNKVSGGATEGFGGGVYALGDVAIENSTIAGNSVENPGLSSGGGVLAGISPVDASGTTAVLLNSTIAGNSVIAGGSGGGFAIDNPTAAVVTAFSAKNTIVAGNTVGGAPADCSGVLAVSSSNNISGDNSCGFADGGSRQSTDPMLGPLQDNGGQTDTRALLAASPAIDTGTNDGCPPADQRGIVRPQGTACDIGAFELGQAAVTSPPSADLGVKLKPKPKRFKHGKKVRFLLTVSNAGPDPATAVVVNGAVPAGTRKVKGRKIAGKRPCKVANPKRAKTKHGKRRRKLTCALGTIAAGGGVKLKIVVQTGTSRKVRARAQVRSAVADPVAKNNRAKAVARMKKSRKRG